MAKPEWKPAVEQAYTYIYYIYIHGYIHIHITCVEVRGHQTDFDARGE